MARHSRLLLRLFRVVQRINSTAITEESLSAATETSRAMATAADAAEMKGKELAIACRRAGQLFDRMRREAPQDNAHAHVARYLSLIQAQLDEIRRLERELARILKYF